MYSIIFIYIYIYKNVYKYMYIYMIYAWLQVGPSFGTKKARRDEGVLLGAIMMMMVIRRRWDWCSLWDLRASTCSVFFVPKVFEHSLLFEHGVAFIDWNAEQKLSRTCGIGGI